MGGEKAPSLLRPSSADLIPLVQRAGAGDAAAQEALLGTFQPLLRSMVRRYSRPGTDAPVLRSYAEEAVLTAARTYDPARSAPATYFRAAIKHALLRVVSSGLIAIPDSAQRQLRHLRETRARLEQALQRELYSRDDHELANATGLRVSRIRTLRELPRLQVSLPRGTRAEDWGSSNEDKPSQFEELEWKHREAFHRASTHAAGSRRSPEQVFQDALDAAMRDLQPEVLRETVARLDVRARDIVTAHFGLEGRRKETHAAIGARYGVTGEAIRKQERHTFDAMRTNLGRHPAFAAEIERWRAREQRAKGAKQHGGQ
jgi:RNA polymerase sigma factor (sigma-70 family)